MKLAYLTSEYPARSHTFIRREIEVMREQGFEVLVYSLHRCPESEILNEDEQRIYDNTWSVFPIAGKKLLYAHLACLKLSLKQYLKALKFGFKFTGGSLKGFVFTFFYFAEAIYLSEQLREDKINALHVHFANSGAKVGAIAAKHLQIPWMLSLHGTVDFEYPAILWLQSMISNADSIRCVSDYGASQAKRVITRSEYNKIYVSYCGLPSNYRNISADIKPLTKSNPVKLLSVGRLSPEKGQILLIEAMLKLKQAGHECILDIVGDGPDRDMLVTECLELDLVDIVHFHGAVEESSVFDFMRNANIFICSSFMEGLPQVLMEAMLLNTPVVAPYIAGIPELVTDRETGMLFPAGNVDILVEGVLDLANNERLYKKIALTSRQRVLDTFLFDTTITPLSKQSRTLLS